MPAPQAARRSNLLNLSSSQSALNASSLQSDRPTLLGNQRQGWFSKSSLSQKAGSTADPGDSPAKARNLGQLSGQRKLKGAVDRRDRNDYYRFTLSGTSVLDLALKGLRGNADIQVLDHNKQAIAHSRSKGTALDSINCTLQAGTYYLRVYPQNGKANYVLNLGSSPVNPLSTPPTQGGTPEKWTVMVYVAANNLEQFAIQDFRELSSIGSNSNVNIVVQFDRTGANHPSYTSGYVKDDTRFGNWTDTRRGLIQAGDSPGLSWGTSVGEVNMGDPNSLQSFVTWSMENYQAERYALVMWGHGSGFAVSEDDIFNDSITASELNGVLSNLSKPLDLIGSDACLMGTAEFAHAVRNHASVYVGSEENEPGTGWSYAPMLQDLVANPTMTPAEWGASIVTRYEQRYGKGEETLSAIDLTSLRSSNPNNLYSTLDQFANTIISSATTSDLWGLNAARTYNSYSFAGLLYPHYIDIGNLFSDVVNNSSISSNVRDAAQNVLNAYSSAIIKNYSGKPGKATGLSIYLPSSNYIADSDYLTQNASFAAETQWDELINWA